MRKAGVTLLFLGALSGCATAPPDEERPIAGGDEVARSVQLCRTTLAELMQRLGTPSRDGWVGNTRVVTWVVAWDPLVRYLGVVVDHRGVVVDRYWNAPSEVAWVPANRCPPGEG